MLVRVRRKRDWLTARPIENHIGAVVCYTVSMQVEGQFCFDQKLLQRREPAPGSLIVAQPQCARRKIGSRLGGDFLVKASC